MGKKLESDNCCLFCGSHIPISLNSGPEVPPENVVIKLEPSEDPPDSDAVSGYYEDKCVQSHVKAVFIVRKLLDVPVEKCAEYLQRNQGDGHPGSWFTLCSQCIPRVEEAYQLFRTIEKLKGKLEKMKCDFKNQVMEYRVKGTRGRFKKREFVLHDIRKFVISRVAEIEIPNSGGSTFDDFENNVTLSIASNSSQEESVKATKKKRQESKTEEVEDVLKSVREARRQIQDKNPDKLKCELCPAQYAREIHMKAHLKLHKRKTGRTCKICGFYCLPRNFKRHMERHQVKKSYKCDICPGVFTTEYLLKKHHKVHKSAGKSIACPVCGRLVATKNLTPHIQAHHPQRVELTEKMPFYCGDCHMIFTRPEKMRGHRILYHSHIPPVSCSICNDKHFETKQYLEIHMSKEHPSEFGDKDGRTEKPSCCPHCHEVLKSVWSRDYHIAQFHKDKLLTCQICGYVATKYSYFVQHHQINHQKLTFACDTCHRKFTNSKCLRSHQNTHLRLKKKEALCLNEQNILKRTKKLTPVRGKQKIGRKSKSVSQDTEVAGSTIPEAQHHDSEIGDPGSPLPCNKESNEFTRTRSGRICKSRGNLQQIFQVSTELEPEDFSEEIPSLEDDFHSDRV